MQTLETRNSQSRPNLVAEIFNLKSKIANSITITWVPSHVGIRGNEKADKLAQQGLKHPTIDHVVNRESSEITEDIKNHITLKWQQEWSASSTGAHNRLVAPNVSFNIKYVDKSRTKERIISRLRLGKCLLNYYLFKQNNHPTGLCNTCNVFET